MKKVVFLLVTALTIVSCSKEKDLYNPEPEVDKEKQAVADNVKAIFGVEFDQNQDWKMMKTGKVTIVANAAEEKGFKTDRVQVLTANPFIDASSTKILNEKQVKAGEECTLVFDVPNYLDTLYAACVSKDNRYRVMPFALSDKTVSFTTEASSRKARAAKAPVATPMVISEGRNSDNLNMVLKTPKANDEKQWDNSGWNDHFYDISTTVNELTDFTTAERNEMFKVITGIMPENTDNSAKVMQSEYFINTANYFYADGTQEPITVTPVRVWADFLGWESLYYYYYNPAQVEGLSDNDRALFLKQLPKYKLLECADALVVGGNSAEDRVRMAKNNPNLGHEATHRLRSYTLAYFGDGEPTNGTTGSYQFPAGYRIGLMFRVDSFPERPGWVGGSATNVKSAVNFYADSLLNNEPNRYARWNYGWWPGHGTTSTYLGPNKSRAAIFSANGKAFIGFEDLVDRDYNDVVFEVNGGVTLYEDSIRLDRNVYTMAFEDRRLGDYDLNDVVIKAQRVDQTHVKYSLEGTGAEDELYLRNINGQKLNATTEVHAIFGQTGKRAFINTVEEEEHIPAVQEIIEVPADFSFAVDANLPYIYNKTMNWEVHIARLGEDPHAIIIPNDFRYPREQKCVRYVYSRFNEWGTKKVDSTDWYLEPTEGLYYTKSVFK
ncbi:MAG: LruC domain-containing protein [Prevotella sp.]|nr:LruC domain-containing protein [Prevotella sp.]